MQDVQIFAMFQDAPVHVTTRELSVRHQGLSKGHSRQAVNLCYCCAGVHTSKLHALEAHLVGVAAAVKGWVERLVTDAK